MSLIARRVVRALAVALGVVCTAASCDAELLSPEFERVAAERAALDFVSRHRDVWRVDVRGTDSPAVLEVNRACNAPGDSGLNALLLSGGGARVTLYLDCAVAAGASATELSAALAFVAIEELPHGIASPGWKFRVLSPSTTIADGVTIDVARGRSTVHIDTPLFAVFGYSERPRCQPPQDSFRTNDCFLQHSFDVPLRLSLSVPYRD